MTKIWLEIEYDGSRAQAAADAQMMVDSLDNLNVERVWFVPPGEPQMNQIFELAHQIQALVHTVVTDGQSPAQDGVGKEVTSIAPVAELDPKLPSSSAALCARCGEVPAKIKNALGQPMCLDCMPPIGPAA